MSNLKKVEVIVEFWYKGKYYKPGEYLFLTFEAIQEIGTDNFVISKDLKNPPQDKMVKSPCCSK